MQIESAALVALAEDDDGARFNTRAIWIYSSCATATATVDGVLTRVMLNIIPGLNEIINNVIYTLWWTLDGGRWCLWRGCYTAYDNFWSLLHHRDTPDSSDPRIHERCPCLGN